MSMELHGVLSQGNEGVLYARLAQLAGELSFDYHSYGILTREAVHGRGLSIRGQYPAQWIAHYLQRQYQRIDPVVQAALAGAHRVIWSEALFESVPALWSEARAAGLRHGVSFTVWDRSGALGLYSLVRESRAISPREQRVIADRSLHLIAACHPQLVACFEQRNHPLPRRRLTAREREVVLWTAEGKTAYEIGVILSISERTVNFHIRNIMGKLRAANKIHAVVMALASGAVGPW